MGHTSAKMPQKHPQIGRGDSLPTDSKAARALVVEFIHLAAGPNPFASKSLTDTRKHPFFVRNFAITNTVTTMDWVRSWPSWMIPTVLLPSSRLTRYPSLLSGPLFHSPQYSPPPPPSHLIYRFIMLSIRPRHCLRRLMAGRMKEPGKILTTNQQKSRPRWRKGKRGL